MKKILSAIVLCCGINMVNAQSADKTQAHIEDNNHKMIGTVKTDGSIYKDKALVCQIKNNGTILNGDGQPFAYITTEGAIQNGNHTTIGYINGADLQDANHKAAISIKPDGAIVNGNNAIVGYEYNTEPMWVGLYFFLFNK